jgi:hypothetical protein
MSLDFRVITGIFEAYSRLHPALRTKASWRMGIEEWNALRSDARLQNVVTEIPGASPLAAPLSMTLCSLPVQIVSTGPHADVELVIRTSP